jgi:polyhydroxybutyrate depolymerase
MTRAAPTRAVAIVAAAVAALVLALAAAGLTAAIARAAAPDPCTVAPVPGSRGVHLSFGGQTRSFQLHVPPGIGAGHPLPLVLALHGAGNSGSRMERYSGFSIVADAHKFVVAYPSALGATWNITAARSRADDVGFIATVITEVEESVCIDPARVYATGVSNGAGMVALLGCRLSSWLTAIAPVDGIYTGEPHCRVTRPVSMLEIHGTADHVAPYYLGEASDAAAGVPALVKDWVRRDRCRGSSRTRTIAPRATLFMWNRCSGALVEHIRVQNGAHQWPGAMPPDPGPPATFSATNVIWSFFAPLVGPASQHSGGVGF